MKTFFKELFDYNNHFNTKLAKLILANQRNTPKKSIQLFCHILNAHEIWNSRIQGKANVYRVWDIHNPNDFHEIIRLNGETTNTIIEKLPLNEMIEYSKSKTQKKISDVLFHIINHSTYHRGQIATEFKENGIEPIPTDFVHYERKG